MSADPTDLLLEHIVRDWVTSAIPDKADIIVHPETRGGPAGFEVRPRNGAALTVRLWVADDGVHVSFSLGAHSWWDGGVSLAPEPVGELLSAVAAGRAGEEVRRIGNHIVARRGYIDLKPGSRLTYGQLNPFSVVPGLPWSALPCEPY